MIVGTCREIELPANHSLRPVLVDLQREQAVEPLTIGRLTDEQIRALVSPLPEPVVHYIQTSAAGNPFFAEGLARGVGASHFAPSQPAAPGAATTHEAAGTPGDLHLPTTLPDTISAVLDLRLGRISISCQHLLARATILGGSFEFNTILAMEAGSPGAAEDTILDLLDEALQAGILTEEGSGARIIYHFWHPLLVSHLYDGLSAGRRASLHRRAAEVLREIYQGSEEEGAAAIVYHLVNGGAESSQIAYYAELAGDRAYGLSAYPEAERHYWLAVEHIGTLPGDASADECLRLANLLECLGECMTIEGNYEEARRFYERVLEARSSIATSQREAQYQAIVWSEIGWTWRYTGDTEQARQCCRRGEQLLQQANVSTGSAWASLRYLQSSLYWKDGRHEEAQRAARETLELFDQEQTQQVLRYQTRIQRTLAGDPVNRGRVYRLLAALAVTSGQHQETLNYLNQALAIFEQEDQQREIAIVCVNLGDLYLRIAKHALAQDVLHRAFTIFERMGDRANMSVCLANLVFLAARTGDLTTAEAQYKRALTLAQHINDPGYISLWYGYLAAALLDQGKLTEAASALCRALSVSRDAQLADCSGFNLVVLGSLRLAQALERQVPASVWQRQLGRAESTLKHALAVKGLEAETSIEAQVMLARVALLQGDLEDALQQAMYVLNEARTSESSWLVARASGLIGSILATQNHYEQAEGYFAQALQVSHASGMRLEEARILYSYGIALLRQKQGEQSGQNALQEAHQIFRECHASLDLHLAERLSFPGEP